MKHHVIIETRKVGEGIFSADVAVGGPTWARGWYVTADTRAAALQTLRQDLRTMRPSDTFDFIHAPTDLP